MSFDPGAFADVPPERVTAPVTPLAVAALANVVSVALLLAGEYVMPPVPRHLLGWVASSLIAFTLVILHRLRTDRLRHEEPGFVHRSGQSLAGSLLLWSGIALCAAHSWYFATELAS